jgi:catechol 2,3-dioxygenase-like lactoylglutathione lyase family enzyme
VRVHHIGLVVADLPTTSEFYLRHFGFVPGRALDSTMPHVRELLEVKGGFRGMHIAHPDSNLSIEVFEFEDCVPRERRNDVPGWTHLAINVPDVRKKYAAMCAVGVVFITPPQRFELGASLAVESCFLRDPEGNLVEIRQEYGT